MAAKLQRERRGAVSWWGYCVEHLAVYHNRVRDGVVEHDGSVS